MKTTLSDDVLDDIRESIRASKNKLDANKQTRKSLISQIREAKENIRKGEVAFSSITVDSAQDFIKGELKLKRMFLASLRRQLLLQEILRDVEVVRFRSLHSSLDKLKVPFDTQAFSKKHGSTTCA